MFHELGIRFVSIIVDKIHPTILNFGASRVYAALAGMSSRSTFLGEHAVDVFGHVSDASFVLVGINLEEVALGEFFLFGSRCDGGGGGMITFKIPQTDEHPTKHAHDIVSLSAAAKLAADYAEATAAVLTIHATQLAAKQSCDDRIHFHGICAESCFVFGGFFVVFAGKTFVATTTFGIFHHRAIQQEEKKNIKEDIIMNDCDCDCVCNCDCVCVGVCGYV